MGLNIERLADLDTTDLQWASVTLRSLSGRSMNGGATGEELVEVVRRLAARPHRVPDLLEVDRCFESHLFSELTPTTAGLLRELANERAFYELVESVIATERGSELSSLRSGWFATCITTGIRALEVDADLPLRLADSPAMLHIAREVAMSHPALEPAHLNKTIVETIAGLDATGALDAVLDWLVASDSVSLIAAQLVASPAGRTALAMAANDVSAPLVRRLGERDDAATAAPPPVADAADDDLTGDSDRVDDAALIAAGWVCLGAFGKAIEVALVAVKVFLIALAPAPTDAASLIAENDRHAQLWTAFYRYMPPPHGLVEALDSTPKNTLDELFDFLQSWYGPHRPEYGIDAAVLAAIDMPEPLRRLHGFAGAWPNPHHPSRGIFRAQDALIDPAHYQPDRWGEIVFASENQGVFEAKTLPSAEFPGAEGPEDGYGFDPSLEDWLVRFCMRETVWNSPWPGRQEIEDELVGRIAQIDPFMDARHFPLQAPLPIWFVDDSILVMRFGEVETAQHFFAAKDQSVISGLLQRHGLTRYSQLVVSLGGTRRDVGGGRIVFLPDGSCRLGYQGVSSSTGLLDFDELSERLDMAVVALDGDLWPADDARHTHPVVSRDSGRSGQSDSASVAVLREVAMQGIAAIAESNPGWIPPWGPALPQLIAPEGELAAVTIEFGQSSARLRPVRWSLVVQPDGTGTLASSISQAQDECALLTPGAIDIEDLAARIMAAAVQNGDVEIADDGLRLRTVLHTWPPVFPAPPDAFYAELLGEILSLATPGEYFDLLLEEHPPEILDATTKT